MTGATLPDNTSLGCKLNKEAFSSLSEIDYFLFVPKTSCAYYTLMYLISLLICLTWLVVASWGHESYSWNKSKNNNNLNSNNWIQLPLTSFPYGPVLVSEKIPQIIPFSWKHHWKNILSVTLPFACASLLGEDYYSCRKPNIHWTTSCIAIWAKQHFASKVSKK